MEGIVSAERVPHRLNRVLIVSSDDDLNLLLQFLLETDGFDVIVSKTADTAMQTLLTHPPKAIFLDLGFQDGKTVSLLEFIQETFPKISIFTLVRPELRAWAEKSFETVVQGCLSTPVDYRRVKNLLAGPERKERLMVRRSNPASIAAS